MFHTYTFRPSMFFFKFSSSFSCLLFSSLNASLLAFFSTLRSCTRGSPGYTCIQTVHKRALPPCPPSSSLQAPHQRAVTFRSSLMACFLALLSSLLSLWGRGWVDTLGRSLLLIICMRSTCFAVSPFLGKTLRGIPVLEDRWICLG